MECEYFYSYSIAGALERVSTLLVDSQLWKGRLRLSLVVGLIVRSCDRDGGLGLRRMMMVSSTTGAEADSIATTTGATGSSSGTSGTTAFLFPLPV